MKIHLITNLFHPDELAGAALYTDFAGYFQERGHELRITAAFSYYPAWKLRDQDRGVKWRDEIFRGAPLRRISMYIPRRPRGLSRLWSDATFLLSILRHGTYKDWTPDVVVTACPMLSQCVAQRFLYRGQKAKRLIIVQDFVVDAALELGILKMPGLPRLLRALERWALRSGDRLTTISPEMLEKLHSVLRGGREAQYIPNWVHEDLDAQIRRQSGDGAMREARTLFYSGNLGVKQGLPDFMDMFANFGAPWTLRIHGGGAEIERIREKKGAANVVLGPVEEAPAYVTRLRQCTACLITQRAGVSANFLPSKLLPALATGTPVLAIAERETPLAREVEEGGYGAVVTPGDGPGLRAALSKMASEDVRRAMGQKAVRRAAFFDRGRVLEQYEALLRGMTEGA